MNRTPGPRVARFLRGKGAGGTRGQGGLSREKTAWNGAGPPGVHPLVIPPPPVIEMTLWKRRGREMET